jgi:hypothetical protein
MTTRSAAAIIMAMRRQPATRNPRSALTIARLGK